LDFIINYRFNYFSFDLARESSGFNRYLSDKEIKEGHSIYNKISENNIKLFDSNKPEDQGEPFINAMGRTAIYFMFVVIFYLLLMMLIAFLYGINSECTSINKINYGGANSYKMFGIEIIAALIFNFIGSLISHVIKEGTIKGSFTSSSIMGIAAVVVHTACQYSGVYSSNCKNPA